MRSESGLLEKFIQHCHAKKEGLSDTYITQIYSNMQELLLIQFLNEELQHQQSKVDELQFRIETSLDEIRRALNCVESTETECVLRELEQALKGESNG